MTTPLQTNTVPPLRVAVVEDQQPTLDEIVRLIQSIPGKALAWTAGTLGEARRHLRNQPLDFLICDIGLPDGPGIDLIAEARQSLPALPILVLTVFSDEYKVVGAIERGALGYLLKDEGIAGLNEAIDEVQRGGSPISPGIARLLMRRIALHAPDAGEPGKRSEKLTDREHQVLELAAKGFTHAEIGDLLSLSASTVASYTRRIYEKLEVSSRAEAVYEAHRLGILKRD